MSIGSRIKEAREKAGYSQVRLSEIIGVSKGAIGNYESDKSSPKDTILFKIMETLHVDANFIFQDEMKELQKNSPTPAKAEAGELEQDDLELLEDYHKLNESGKEAARNAVRGLTYAPNYQQLKEKHSVEMADIADDAIRTIDKLTEMTRKNQNGSLRKK